VFIFILASLQGGGTGENWTTFRLDESGGIVELDGLKIHFGSEAFDTPVDVQVRVMADAKQLARDHEQLLLDRGGFWIPVGPIYAVELPPGMPLGAWVEVALPYEPDLLGGSDPQALSGAAWNGAWWEQKPGTVDLTAQTVTFLLDHFSEVAVVISQDDWRVEMGARGRPDWQIHTSPSGRFQIRFTRDYEHAVLGDQDYHTPFDPSLPNPDQVPLFIRDLGYFLDEAAVMIQPMGYAMPPRDEIVTVEVRNLNIGRATPKPDAKKTPLQVDGATGAFGPIYIDSRLHGSNGPRSPGDVWERLLVTATHEFYHVVQRYNPSFPTWFYEASAAYLEWKLFAEYFPDMYANSYGKPGQDFLAYGMWGGTITEHYAKAAFLIYLDQHYSSQCGNLILEGFHPFGGSSYGVYTANLKHPDMRQAFVGAAQRCGGYSGTWEDLLVEFATRYYADWEAWPGAGDLISSVARMRPYVHDHSLDKNPGGDWSFQKHAWAYDSAQLWRIGSMQAGSPTPRSTLVLRLVEEGQADGPAYRAYPLSGRVQQDVIGPFTFSRETPTLAVPDFGSLEQGATVNQVYLVGVYTKLVEAYTVFPHTLEAYLLPEVKNIRAEYVKEGYGKGTIAVTWEVDETYIPNRAEFVVYTSQDAGWPLQKEVSRQNRRSRETNISFDPNVVSVSVVLVDSYGNQSPMASIPISEPARVDFAADEVMVAALHRLGIQFEPDLESCTQTGCWFTDYERQYVQPNYEVSMQHVYVWLGHGRRDIFKAYELDQTYEDVTPEGPPQQFGYRGLEAWIYRANTLSFESSGFNQTIIILGTDWNVYLAYSVICPHDMPQCDLSEIPSLYHFADAILNELAARNIYVPEN